MVSFAVLLNMVFCEPYDLEAVPSCVGQPPLPFTDAGRLQDRMLGGPVSHHVGDF